MLSWIIWVLKCLQTSLTSESRSYSEHGGKPSVLSTAEFSPSLKRSTMDSSNIPIPHCCCSVAKLHPAPWDPWTAACQAPLSSTVSQSLLKSWPLSQWCHLTISLSDAPFSFRLQSFLTSGSFPMSWLFTSNALVHQHKWTKTPVNS